MPVGCGARCMKKWIVLGRRILFPATLAMLFLLLIYDNSDKLLLQTRKDKHDGGKDDGFMNISDVKHYDIGERFELRSQHLEMNCNNKSLDSKATEYSVKSHLIIDDRHKLIYCFIEKTGCTFWKRVFQILNGFKNVTDPFQTRGMEAYGGYKTAEGMSFYSINCIFGRSKKFLFVREPYERLLSGYVDKLFLPVAPYWLDMGQYITKNFRQKTNTSAIDCGTDVTFEEFVRYFIHSQETNEKSDVHFTPSYDHCRPCEIRYDYIGKLETFQEDTLFLLNELKLNKAVQIKNFEEKTEKDAIIDAVDWCYTVDKTVDSCISRNERLFRTYRKLQIRGLISKDIPFPFSRKKETNIGIDQCKQTFLDIHARSGSAKARKENRREAYVEAYSSLSRDLLQQLQEHLRPDTELFGYDEFPGILKNAVTQNPRFQFFNIKEFSGQMN